MREFDQTAETLISMRKARYGLGKVKGRLKTKIVSSLHTFEEKR
jgi:hypothetical protein